MRSSAIRVFIVLLLFVSPSLFAATYNIGPGKTYTNIGDAPWSSVTAGDTVNIYPKADITAVTASSSTGTTITLTTSAASIPYGSTLWFSGYQPSGCTAYNDCPALIPTTCGVYGSGLYGNPTGGSACSGDTVTLLLPVTIGSGVTVYFQPPYFEKILLTNTGTSGSPITVQGIPDATTGALPVLDADDCTTGPNMPTYGLTKYHAGLAQVVFTFNTAETAWTQYLTLSHLRVQNAITGVTMYDASNTAFTYNDPYGIYLQEAEHVTLLDNEIINNTGGTFGAANGPDTCNYCDFDNYLTLQGNHFFYNGQVAAFHQSYIEGYMVSYIGNFFDRIKQGGSTQLKDRSTGTVIAYNLFYPGAHALDLVDAQNSFFTLVHQIDVTVPTGGFSANATSLTFTPLTVSGNTTNGSIIISISSTTGITQDMAISGTGIPVGATVILVSGSSIQISSPATATGSPTLTIGGVAGINIGDIVGYDAAAGWGYAGSGSPVMPTVSNVNTSTNTLTLNSPGIPASLSAGAALQVISRQLYPYMQTFVYGNIFGMNQLFLTQRPERPYTTVGTRKGVWIPFRIVQGHCIFMTTLLLSNGITRHLSEHPPLSFISDGIRCRHGGGG